MLIYIERSFVTIDMTLLFLSSLANIKLRVVKEIFRLRIKFAQLRIKRDNSIFIVNPCRFLFPHCFRYPSEVFDDAQPYPPFSDQRNPLLIDSHSLNGMDLLCVNKFGKDSFHS